MTTSNQHPNATSTEGTVRTIEQEIGQTKPFVSPQQRAMVNVLFTHSWLTEQLRERMQPFGITMQQYNVLRILRGANDPISTSQIRDRMLDRMSDTSRLVDRLEKKGWVERRTCPKDKRLVDVWLSEAGIALLASMEQMESDFDTISGCLSDEQATTLSDLLDQLRAQ